MLPPALVRLTLPEVTLSEWPTAGVGDGSLNHVATVENEFAHILGDRLLRTVFQPIVNVESGAVVGYEGLISGPAGSILESPEALIKRRTGKTALWSSTGLREPQ
jgi:hypothetical protein